MPFRERIQQMISDSPGLGTSDHELFSHPLMREVVGNPARFQNEVQIFLRERPKPSRTEVRVALQGLQCLDKEPYLRLVDSLADEANKGIVDEWALFYSVAPGVLWSTRLALSYREPAVRETLMRASNSRAASDELKKLISQILSGEMATFIAEEKIKPALKCSARRRQTAKFAPK